MTDEALTLLRALIDGQRALAAEICALRAAIERGHGPRDPNADRHAAAILLHAVAAAFSVKRDFSVKELLAHAKTPEGEALRAAFVGAVGSLNGKKLGRLLRRIEREDLEGLYVEAIGEDRGALVYILREGEKETR